MRITLRTYFLALVGLCFAVTLFSMVLVAGVEATPWETQDSRGGMMRYNDRFSPEHYWIAFGNFRPASLFQVRFAYEWLVLVALLVGAWCLRSEARSARRATRWYFLAQLAVFFPGTLCVLLLYWPILVVQLIGFQANREDFVDLPITQVLTQSPWVLVSLTIALALPGQSLGLKEAFTRIRALVGRRDLIADR
jgi:hypothetical protein